MTNQEYVRRLGDACGDPAKIAIVQGEYTTELLSAFQLRTFDRLDAIDTRLDAVLALAPRIAVLEERVAALEAVIHNWQERATDA